MKLSNIKKVYGENTVLDCLNLEISEHTVTAVMGASGAGKTTLLQILAGLISYEGTVEREDDSVSYIFQGQRLLPNLTVEGNLDYVLRNQTKDRLRRKQKIEEMLKRVRLYEDRKKYPAALSGGMAQRVSLARAFLYESNLLLMDEPFKGLDVSLKKHIIDIFKTLYRDDGRTVVFVTHDIEEALSLSDRVIILDAGGAVLLDEKMPTPFLTREREEMSLSRERIYNVL